MSKQLFPIEIIDNSAEKLISKHSKRSYIIYNIVIVLVIIFVIFSFIINVEINTTSQGIVKTPGERVLLTSPYSGFISQINVKENQIVQKGDLLMALNTDRYCNELSKVQRRIDELNSYVADLNKLIRLDKKSLIKNISLQTGLYKQSMSYFTSQLADLQTRVKNIESNYIRNRKLRDLGVISSAEFELIEADYLNTKNAIELLLDRQINSWQVELDRFIVEKRELLTQSSQLNIQISDAEVYSPVDGIVQRVEGISAGSYLQQGQKLIEISVDSTLYIECVVEPRNIGYLKVGQSVSLQVDAFNYNEWGMARGKISEIYHDVLITQKTNVNMPYFKVICRLDTEYLELKNGYRGYIKRGMTVNVRFKITERTLFQLLYDKVDDWMNPNNMIKQ